MDIPVVEMEGLTQNLIPNFDKPAPRRRGGGGRPSGPGRRRGARGGRPGARQ